MDKLQELEGVWKESGSIGDEARYLEERVKAGNLSAERLELAAYLGHEAAQGLVERVWSVDWKEFRSLERWLAGLEEWGIEPVARAVSAATDSLIARLGTDSNVFLRCPFDGREISAEGCDSCQTGPGYAALAAQAWRGCPCDLHAQAVRSQLSVAGTFIVPDVLGEDVSDSWGAEEHSPVAVDVILQAVAAARHDLLSWALEVE